MSFLIDIAILVLLVGTLTYAWVVDRRVRVLMAALKDLEPMIGSFSAAVDKSESTVTALRSAGEQVADQRARRQREPEVSRDEAPSFRTTRERPSRPNGTASVSGKSELVRGFFETVRNREA
ncbi:MULTISPECIES: flagellar motor switch protein [Roseobacteraceae]|uniref:flagellar motor switch protein n=1 Tax=Roseobacteraceae TaxID=2854170 RepID=UPI00080AAA6F|nr:MULTISPECIES: flagellar motor switch protein [Roseobacteraceae]ANT63193.1 flagellar motor switch protein [Salipiger sp. CCB-MM3]MCA0994924.1 flagellar motor switch protein [Alloyangia pacifica]NDW00985.1 flagellar motor switch protein [Salipiger sp. PrR002]NDW56532.1 flagellar motor switch protein [Salipiger sp. PrR004]